MKKLYSITVILLLSFAAVNAQNLCFDEAADVNYATGNGPQSVAQGDFNEDGDLDVVVVNYLQGNLSLFMGNGNGTFDPQITMANGNFPTEVEVADINGDNNADIIWCQNSGGVIVSMLGNGNGTFQNMISSAINAWDASYRQQFILADISDDGDLDAIINDHDGDRIIVMIGDGNGSFSSAQTLTTGNQPLDVEIGDFNNDGNPDIICGYAYSENFITIFMNNGSGALNNGVNISVGEPFYFYLEVGKFDSDNFDDFVVSGLTTMYFLSGNGNGTFDAPTNFAMGGYAGDIVANDFNENGELDVALCIEYGGLVACVSGNGMGTFSTYISSSAKGNPIDLVEGDFDGDGFLDLATANYGNDHISFLKGYGDGTFGPDMFNTTGAPESLAVGDVDNDGNLDIVTAESFPGGLTLMMGLGDGTSEPSVNLIPALTFQDVAVMDINNDNFDDIVALYSSSLIGVLISNGDGTFDPQAQYPAGSGAGGDREIFLSDVNNDGYLDALAVYMQDDQFSVLLNNGNGTFAAETIYNTGDMPMDIIAADYNGDGFNDVAVPLYSTNSVAYFANNGNGTFTAPLSIPAGLSPRSVVAGDWNNDGDLDFASSNTNSVDISIFIQPDGGGLPTQTTISTGNNSSPLEVVAADINGDGNLDLAVALASNNSIGLFLGNGDGTFQSMLNYNVEQSPYDVATGDFNNDGIIDLAAANNASYSVSVVLNNSAFVSAGGPTTFCQGGSVSLTASTGYSYLWSSGQTTQTIVVTETGEYSCAITNQSGTCTLITAATPVTVNDSEINVQIFDGVWENACAGDLPFALDGGSPQGGTYAGTGVNNGIFDPGVGQGTYAITYTFEEQGGCASGSATADLIVFELPVITFTAQFPDLICIEEGALLLEGAIPLGGLYTGNGVVDNIIDPNLTGEGTFSISYSYTNENGCTGEDTVPLVVDMCSNIFANSIENIAVYPTLATNLLFVQLGSNSKYRITDMHGSSIESGWLVAGTNSLNIEELAAGKYILTANNRSFLFEKIK
ncbi:MAG: VCBS repeat-containing protein [Flavobacteriales bacterium]|nr:VCBS repeat-containing protein [Flavobacteriales bacterium]